jgi:curved DNA-binding protein CbpA
MSNRGHGLERSYYEVLGVENDCTAERLKTKYRELAREHHPDRLVNETSEVRESAVEEMAAINEAYHTLSDLELRRAYDQHLRAQSFAQHSARHSPPESPRDPLLGRAILALAIGGVVALFINTVVSDKRGLSEELAPVAPLLRPYVQKGRTQPGPQIKELLQTPEGTLLKRALQPEMTADSCLRAFPHELQRRP